MDRHAVAKGVRLGASNRTHAVAYALVAYKTAFLKAHYPVDFMAANLSAEIGSTGTALRRMSTRDIGRLPVVSREDPEKLVGYLGRTGIFEFLPVSDEIRQMISERIDSLSIRNTALSRGMKTLRTDGFEKAAKGIT